MDKVLAGKELFVRKSGRFGAEHKCNRSIDRTLERDGRRRASVEHLRRPFAAVARSGRTQRRNPRANRRAADGRARAPSTSPACAAIHCASGAGNRAGATRCRSPMPIVFIARADAPMFPG
jgi:hypothetical protein